MLAKERQSTIERRIRTFGKVVSADLASEFGVSEDAIRRDLRELAREGKCRRVYGGALMTAPNAGDIVHRETLGMDAKKGLAACVAKLIEDNQTIFIDASSTNIIVARELPRDKSITVFTNSPGVALALSSHSLCRTIIVGGTYNSSKGACLDARTVREARNTFADLFILGACGLDLDTGITALDVDEAEVKRCLIEQSSRLILPITKNKLGTAAPYKIADTSAIDTLIVENGADMGMLEAYRALGINILTTR